MLGSEHVGASIQVDPKILCPYTIYMDIKLYIPRVFYCGAMLPLACKRASASF